MKLGTYACIVALLGAGGIALACSSKTQQACEQESDSDMCKRLGLDCELLTGFDNCGLQRTINCGTCTAPAICGVGALANHCVGVTSKDAGGTDASDAASCTFTCPKAKHFIEGNSAPQGQNISQQPLPFVISFDEGKTGESALSNSLNQTIVDISNVTIEFDDSNGNFSSIWASAPPDSNAATVHSIALSYDTLTMISYFIFELDRTADGGTTKLIVTCSGKGLLMLGPDQFPLLPDSLACTNGHGEIDLYAPQASATDTATASFNYQ